MEQIPVGWLNAFLVFSQSPNITEAAEKLHITQPALSKQLKRLEQSLAEPVFILKGRKKALTPFGEHLRRSLEQRLGNLQETVRQTRALYGDPEQALIRISARRGVLDRISPRLRFAGRLYLLEAAHDAVLDSLSSFRTEIGISYAVPDAHGLIAKPLFQEKFRLVIPKALFPARPALGTALLASLRTLPCIGYRPEDEVLQALCARYASDARGLTMVRATESYQAIAEMVNVGMGWAMVPSYIAVPGKSNWLLPVPVPAVPMRKFSLIYRAEYKAVPWFKDLLGEIQSCFAE